MDDPKDTPIALTRKDARAQGITRFWTGNRCLGGHIDYRGTASGACLTCLRETMRARRALDPARIQRLEAAKAIQIPERDRRPILSRRDATERGLSRYFTGAPCVNGHFSERMTRGKQCLACHREAQGRTRQARPDAIKAIKARSYAAHRDHVIAHVEAYEAANPEKVRQRRRKHREVNKKRLAEVNAEWRAENRHISRQHERNRRAREAGAEGHHTAAQIADLLKKQRYQCAGPGCDLSLRKVFHVDHIQPLSRGGSNWIANIQLLCPRCNQSKHARDPIEWAQSLGRLL